MRAVNEVNMAKWIVALRSGEYQQTKGCLRAEEGGMCCMGVACDISGLGTWAPKQGSVAYFTATDPHGDTAVLPIDVRDWLKVGDSNPRVAVPKDVEPFGGKRACSGINDDLGWTFAQIADALESEYLSGKKAEQILEAA